MTGDLKLSAGADTVRLLGCTDLAAGQGFSLVLGNIQNQLQFAVSLQNQPPVTLETSHGFVVRASGSDVMHVGRTHLSLTVIELQIFRIQPNSTMPLQRLMLIDRVVTYLSGMSVAFRQNALKIGLY